MFGTDGALTNSSESKIKITDCFVFNNGSFELHVNASANTSALDNSTTVDIPVSLYRFYFPIYFDLIWRVGDKIWMLAR